jgi:hypothetical protein
MHAKKEAAEACAPDTQAASRGSEHDRNRSPTQKGAQCKVCGAETAMYVGGEPICVNCDDEFERQKTNPVTLMCDEGVRLLREYDYAALNLAAIISEIVESLPRLPAAELARLNSLASDYYQRVKIAEDRYRKHLKPIAANFQKLLPDPPVKQSYPLDCSTNGSSLPMFKLGGHLVGRFCRRTTTSNIRKAAVQ